MTPYLNLFLGLPAAAQFAIAFAALALALFVAGWLLVAVGRIGRGAPLERPLVFGWWSHVLGRLLPALTDREELRKDLRRAGYYHRHAVIEFLALRNAGLVGCLLAAAAAYWFIARPEPRWLVPLAVLAIAVGIIAFSLPRLILQAQAAARLRRVQHALPDALDMITMAMTGGLPLTRAIEQVGRELRGAHPDLALEFGIIHRHMQTGSLELALRQFADRVDIPDVQALSVLVSQTERLGANVASAFQDYADSTRRSIRQRAEERGNKASVKLLFPVVFCLAPPVYILLLAPAVLELRKFVIDQNEPGGILAQDVSVENPTVIRPRLVNDPAVATPELGRAIEPVNN